MFSAVTPLARHYHLLRWTLLRRNVARLTLSYRGESERLPPVFRRFLFAGLQVLRSIAASVAVLILLTGISGCGNISSGGWGAVSEGVQTGLPNPLSLPLVSRDLVMDEVSDEIDDYFSILREQRIRLNSNILTEGWIDTSPRIGSTILEPWRKDSTPGFEVAHATLQTVRRWAKVRVIPNGNQYLVDVKVYKELEDLQEPEHSTVSGRTARHDNSLDFDRYERDDLLLNPPNRGWIPMGRDVALEQTILTNIQLRIEQAINGGADCQ